MKQGTYCVIENKQLTPTTWRMKLQGDVSAVTAPGQFINIKLDGHFLRRPISICDVECGTCKADPYHSSNINTPDFLEGIITIIYKVLGHGTEEMTSLEPGYELDVLTGLGNGYDLCDAGERPLLIGGGVGIPPMYLAARRLKEQTDADVTVILGFNTSDEAYYIEEFEELGCKVVTASADGSLGIKGFVTDAFDELMIRSSVSDEGSEKTPDEKDGLQFSYFFTCGPEPMLRAVYDKLYTRAGISGQMSFEERMGCGFGACMGCSCRTVTGYKRICKDGPVLRTEEILWQ